MDKLRNSAGQPVSLPLTQPDCRRNKCNGSNHTTDHVLHGTARISRRFLKDFDLRSTLTRDLRAAYDSATKALDIPALLADALRMAIRGDGNVGVEHHIGTDMGNVIQGAITKLCAAVICAALLLGAVVCRAGEPVLWGLSWVGIVYLVGAAVMAYVIFFHVSRK